MTVSGRRQPSISRFKILMVMERVAAGPVDQFGVGIGVALAVVVERGARAEQHVGYAGDGNEVVDARLELGETDGQATVEVARPMPPDTE